MKKWFTYHIGAGRGNNQPLVQHAWQKGYRYTRPYTDRETFLKAYLTGHYIFWDNFIRQYTEKSSAILSIGSGACVNELALFNDGYVVTCSDLKQPPCYKDAVELFGPFDYLEFDALTDAIPAHYDIIFGLGLIYVFDTDQLTQFFSNVSAGLESGGIFILDGGGPEDNIFSFCWSDYFLRAERYAMTIRKSVRTMSWRKMEKVFHGYRHKNKEVISAANKCGLQLIGLETFDYLTEFHRSGAIRWLTNRSVVTKSVLSYFGRRNPYIRMFAFRKTQ
ncbi:MAG: hypothetical protein CBC21_07705 [Proteobacteria bacterium TMED61]|nr:MAG: hypothetical protein CBC21_07705 [Proteobacteria bacterium TMED61]